MKTKNGRKPKKYEMRKNVNNFKGNMETKAKRWGMIRHIK